jgi:hypothetical protein
MTEAKWLSIESPLGALEFVADTVSHRKLRLFAAACCRRMEYLFPEDRRKCLDVVERWAEGLATFQELEAAMLAAVVGWEPRGEKKGVIRENVAAAIGLIVQHHNDPFEAARAACIYTESAAFIAGKSHAEEGKAQVGILRDIVENPFRSIRLDPVCLTSPIKRMAQLIYEYRRFHELPALAEALEEAGCAEADILVHCRGPEPHVRGCWVMDLILGKN